MLNILMIANFEYVQPGRRGKQVFTEGVRYDVEPEVAIAAAADGATNDQTAKALLKEAGGKAAIKKAQAEEAKAAKAQAQPATKKEAQAAADAAVRTVTDAAKEAQDNLKSEIKELKTKLTKAESDLTEAQNDLSAEREAGATILAGYNEANPKAQVKTLAEMAAAISPAG